MQRLELGVRTSAVLERKSVEAENTVAVNSSQADVLIAPLAAEIYDKFCDHSSFDDELLDWAYYAAVEEVGDGDPDGVISKLMQQTIRYTIKAIWEMQSNGS
jgi:hypothetical protein